MAQKRRATCSVWPTTILTPAADPQPRAVEEEDLQSRAPTVAEDKQRAGSRIFLELFSDNGMEAVEALAQVARFDGQEHLERTGETQHEAPEVRRDFNNAVATGTCRTSDTSIRTPPGR